MTPVHKISCVFEKLEDDVLKEVKRITEKEIFKNSQKDDQKEKCKGEEILNQKNVHPSKEVKDEGPVTKSINEEKLATFKTSDNRKPSDCLDSNVTELILNLEKMNEIVGGKCEQESAASPPNTVLLYERMIYDLKAENAFLKKLLLIQQMLNQGKDF